MTHLIFVQLGHKHNMQDIILDDKCGSQMSVKQVPTLWTAESGGKIMIKMHRGKNKTWSYKLVKR